LSGPRCGSVHELHVPGAEATHAVVITEDAWNERMGDSVVVPLYQWPHAAPSLVLVDVHGLRANCTRVQSMAHDFIGVRASSCPPEAWTRIRLGVRVFLDLDRRISQGPTREPTSPRTGWWPRQDDVHFARNPAAPTQDKLYAAISDDDWNSHHASTHVAAVRLTSRTKPQRRRWEVPVQGGYVVSGDVYAVPLGHFEQTAPRAPYPTSLTGAESAAIATRQKVTLSL
jgi:mRNA-degrading endonuclease toxin of MazEF toxin-antitoxin module